MGFRYEMTAPGVAHVERVEATTTPPAAGEVQVRMRASSLNYHDLVTLLGLIPDIAYPRVPLSDGCGEIVAIGAGVKEWSVGDNVIGLFYPQWHSGRPSRQGKRLILGESTDGCLQEFMNIDARSVVRAPYNLTHEEAATLVCAGHTAWYALVEEGNLRPGQTVLIQGSGGVALFGLQIASALGATIVATSSSDKKLEQLEALGAKHLVNYNEYPQWHEQVMRCSGGVDAVLDLGGENTLGKSVACANVDGFIAVIGVLGGFGDAAVSIIDVMQKNLNLRGVTVGCGASLERFCRFVEQHDVKPVISHRLPASDLAAAVQLMQSGEHFGKISIAVE